jgi:hypothetical protein
MFKIIGPKATMLSSIFGLTIVLASQVGVCAGEATLQAPPASATQGKSTPGKGKVDVPPEVVTWMKEMKKQHVNIIELNFIEKDNLNAPPSAPPSQAAMGCHFVGNRLQCP